MIVRDADYRYWVESDVPHRRRHFSNRVEKLVGEEWLFTYTAPIY